MDLIMEELWDLNYRGFMYEGHLVVPYLIVFCADLEETWQALSRLKGGTFCHLHRLVSNDNFLDHNV
jgi:hypothetical protein